MEVGSHTSPRVRTGWWAVGAGTPPVLYPTARTMLRAIVVARWLSWTWMAGIVAFDGTVQRPALGWGAVAATLALVAVSTALVRDRPEHLIRLPFVLSEVGFAVGLSIVDGFVFEPGHVFATTQSIATQWPLLAMATAGVALGPWRAALLGVLIGPAEWAARHRGAAPHRSSLIRPAQHVHTLRPGTI